VTIKDETSEPPTPTCIKLYYLDRSRSKQQSHQGIETKRESSTNKLHIYTQLYLKIRDHGEGGKGLAQKRCEQTALCPQTQINYAKTSKTSKK
jgi:hypothetical protein